MTDCATCDFEGCDEHATAELRFELTEPGDSTQTIGTFRLCVCSHHSRQEFMPPNAREPRDADSPIS